MKPEAFLPSNTPGPGSASSVPAVPMHAGPAATIRHSAPRAVLSSAQFDEWAAKYLRDNRSAPRAYRSELIEWRHRYQLQQEEAELRANPAAREELRLVAERLGRKAQSSFGGAPTANDATATGSGSSQ